MIRSGTETQDRNWTRRAAVGIPALSGLLLSMASAATPEQRAADYLAQEVPRWARENHCYSCHNNGDAARALLAAKRSGYAIPQPALADTLAWLSRPARWDESKGAPGIANRALAQIQFAAALLDAGLADRKPLLGAAAGLVRLQERDGSWRVDAGGIPGAPATYGAALATYMARRVLLAAELTAPAARATAWLKAAQPENVVDAAAILLGLPERRDCIEYLKSAQASDGGWGPLPHTPAEAFDTAMAILALKAAGPTEPVARGRDWLIRTQQPAGGWADTTRPSGGTSYAEHISTSAWALYALLQTAAESGR